MEKFPAPENSHAEMMGDIGESPSNIWVVSDTRKNPADNEDQALVRIEAEALLVGVFDGATTSEGPRGPGQSPGTIASTIAKTTLKTLPLRSNPRDALLAINAALRSVAETPSLGDRRAVPGATNGLVVFQEKDTVQWASVGDPYLFKIDSHNQVTLIDSDQKMEQFELAEIDAGMRDAARLHITLDSVLTNPESKCWETINDMRGRENNPDGSGCGVMKGGPDEGVIPYIRSGKLVLQKGEQLLLMTDGLTLPVTTPREDRVKFVQQAMVEGGLSQLLKMIRAAEESDPHCETYPRLKRHDDATGILLERR